MRRLATSMCLLLLVAACGGPFSYLKKAEQNPFAGQTIFMQGSLVFSGCDVDGLREEVWLSGENNGWREDWPRAQGKAAAEFARALQSQLQEVGITLTPQANPKGAKYMLNPRVKLVETGGVRATVLQISVKLTDEKGAVLEEISTRTRSAGGVMTFDSRLAQASLLAAGNVAAWVKERAQH